MGYFNAKVSYETLVFNQSLQIQHGFGLPGPPSRACVSPDGRFAATTAFVFGHSYATIGSFSTETRIIDLATGTRLPRPGPACRTSSNGTTPTTATSSPLATETTGGSRSHANRARDRTARESSIDDQIEWLENRQVLYGKSSAVWVANADGSGRRHVFIANASSPAVVQPAQPNPANNPTLGRAPGGSATEPARKTETAAL